MAQTTIRMVSASSHQNGLFCAMRGRPHRLLFWSVRYETNGKTRKRFRQRRITPNGHELTNRGGLRSVHTGRTVVECSVCGFFRVRMVTKEKNPSFFRVEPSNLQPSGAILGCSRARVGGHFSSRKIDYFLKNGKIRKLGDCEDRKTAINIQ